MADRPRVVVVGGSGFVGSAVLTALQHDVEAVPVAAPRIRSAARASAEVVADSERQPREVLARQLAGCDVVVNAAGDPDASSTDEDALVGANAVLPPLLLRACRDAGVRRLVHVSSAVVQNDAPVLDSSEEMAPFSAYSLSKVLGERALRDLATEDSQVQVVRYRPPSVHHASRRVTRGVSRVARSRVASVAGDGSQPSPQALLDNVASAIVFLALSDQPVPVVVHHPWEGLTSYDVMTTFGLGKQPLRLPTPMASASVRSGKLLGRRISFLAANARRVEVMWLGQRQSRSWLEDAGWTAPLGREGWERLAREVSGAPGG